MKAARNPVALETLTFRNLISSADVNSKNEHHDQHRLEASVQAMHRPSSRRSRGSQTGQGTAECAPHTQQGTPHLNTARVLSCRGTTLHSIQFLCKPRQWNLQAMSPPVLLC